MAKENLEQSEVVQRSMGRIIVVKTETQKVIGICFMKVKL